MVNSYDELIGATGRAIFFRPERSRVQDFVSPHARPKVCFDGAEFPVYDLSMNGLSLLAPADTQGLKPGREVDMVLSVYGCDVCHGRARIARVELNGTRARVGLALVHSFIDLPALRRQDAEERLSADLAAGADPFANLVPQTYRQALGRVVLFVQFHRESLRRHEARYRAVGGDEGRSAIANLELRALRALRGPWTELRLAACRAARPLINDRAQWRAAKQMTEAVLTPLLMESPCVRRAYEKPLGYPGDYQVMLYCYADALEGDTVFGRVFHKLWLEHPLPSGVRTRRDLVVNLALEQQDWLVARDGDHAKLRITSLGCGPALEVPSFVDRRDSWQGNVIWSLIDQDEEALSVAYQAAQQAASRATSQTTLRLLNLSFTQLIADPDQLPLVERQHLIASSGLFDYLRAQAARDLLEVLYQRLAPGGLIAVGNAIGPNDDFWSPEFVLNWTLLYRTEEDMRALTTGLPPEAQVQVRLEPGQAYYYLLIRRPEPPN